MAHRSSVSKLCSLVDCNPRLQQRIKRELKGKVPVCHCHPDLSCHGGVLSWVANTEGPIYIVEKLGFIGYQVDPNSKYYRKYHDESIR
jgi:hypothetical protein